MLNPELAFHQPSPLEVFPQGSLSASSREGGKGGGDCFYRLGHYSTESCSAGTWEKLRHESPDGYITLNRGATQVSGYQTQRGRTRARRDLQLQPSSLRDAMHVLNGLIYAWSHFRRKKLGLAVLLSTVAIPAFADTPVQGRTQSPGSLAKPVVVVVVFVRGFFNQRQP